MGAAGWHVFLSFDRPGVTMGGITVGVASCFAFPATRGTSGVGRVDVAASWLATHVLCHGSEAGTSLPTSNGINAR
jgi:hypothetical protein